MATYRLKGPDGSSYDISAPDDATMEQVMAVANQHIGSMAKAPDPSEGGGTLQFGPLDTGIPTPQGVDRFLAGAGAGISHVGRGLGQLVGLSDQASIDEAKKLESPLQATGAGRAGNIAGTITALAPTALIPGAATLGGAAAIGAGTGALTTEGGIGDRAKAAALGGIAGPLAVKAGQVVGGALKSSGPSLTAAQKHLQDIGERLGLSLTPGYASGSKALQKVEAALQSNPVTSGGFDKLASNNQVVLNKIAAKAIGQDGAEELSAPVLGKAFDDIGAIYDKVKTKTPVSLDPQGLTGKLVSIIDDHAGQYAGSADVGSNALFKQLSDFAQKGGATQEQLASLSSNLGKAVKNNFTSPNGDRTLASALAEAKNLVDDSLEGSLSGKLATDFAAARGQYRTLLQLTANTRIVNPSNGNVNANALASLLQKSDRPGFLRGNNATDLYNAARFAQAFPKVVGDSGTATRSLGAADYLAAIPARIGTAAYLNKAGNAGARGTVAGLSKSQDALAALLQNGSLPLSLGTIPAYAGQKN